jgi:hypothetical protein
MSLPCPTFGHNFSEVLVGCWCKRFEMIVHLCLCTGC